MRLPALKTEHDYRTCGDPDCERFPCRIYKEGFTDGDAAGRPEGYAAGYGDGYPEGFSDGAASASH